MRWGGKKKEHKSLFFASLHSFSQYELNALKVSDPQQHCSRLRSHDSTDMIKMVHIHKIPTWLENLRGQLIMRSTKILSPKLNPQVNTCMNNTIRVSTRCFIAIGLGNSTPSRYVLVTQKQLNTLFEKK